MKWFACIAWVCLLGSQTADAGIRIPYSDVFSRYSGSITRITVCGNRGQDALFGRYRVIELYMQGQSFLYIDKVKLNASETEFDVIKGITIEEFDDNHVDIELSGLACQRTRMGISITAKAWDAHDDSSRQVRIVLRESDDRYVIHGF